MLRRYGKASGPLIQFKKAFFDENETLLAERLAVAGAYARQPPRRGCKTCDAPVEGPGFERLGVRFHQCPRCGHLNGANEDTDAFNQAMYAGAGEEDCARVYGDADREAYFARVRDIYRPKADFLFETLTSCGEDPASLSYADLGAGSGHFVAALKQLGVARATGYEVSETQLRLARAMGGDERAFVRHGIDEVDRIAANLDAEVVTMLGMLEHIPSPRRLLAALSANPRVRYAFILVPTFSLSAMIELVFPTVAPRVLNGYHSHLYTESSVQWLCREFGMRVLGEWWFGTDMVDVFRNVLVRLGQDTGSAELTETWRKAFSPLVDELQLVVDRHHGSSEYHGVVAFERV